MNKPVVKLKNIKTFEGMEGYGINADVYINGINCLRMIDSGDGGETIFRRVLNIGQSIIDANIKQLNDYVTELAAIDEKNDLNMNLDIYMNDVWLEMELDKIKKKANKRMLTAIVIGKPDYSEPYSFFQLKKPLKNYLPAELQQIVNPIAFKHCTNGVQILNKNLEALGVNMKHVETLYKV